MLFIPGNKKTITISLADESKYNCKHKNQVVLLMITNGKNWYYLALKSVHTNGYNCPKRCLSRLLRGISSNHIGDYYCLNCFH